MTLNAAVVFIASTFAGLSSAYAQPEIRGAIGAALGAACNNNTRGSAICPTTSMDGSMMVAGATATTLFNGKVPPNGFMVQIYQGQQCMVSDNGPASGAGIIIGGGPPAGLMLIFDGYGINATYTTPPGYKPIGPVSVWCDNSGYVAAKGW
jgi:hypothetical protein